MVLSLAACQSDNEVAGALLGGTTGAVIGNQFGKGDGNKAAIALGAIIGASVGQAIGASLDQTSRQEWANQQERRWPRIKPLHGTIRKTRVVLHVVLRGLREKVDRPMVDCGVNISTPSSSVANKNKRTGQHAAMQTGPGN